jgi:hypothetical protein
MMLREKFIVILLKVSALVFVFVAAFMVTSSLINLLLAPGMVPGRAFIMAVVSPILSLAAGTGAAVWLYRRFRSGGANGKPKTEEL